MSVSTSNETKTTDQRTSLRTVALFVVESLFMTLLKVSDAQTNTKNASGPDQNPQKLSKAVAFQPQ